MTWIGSPNFYAGRDGRPISFVVVHHMAGTLASTDSVFQNKVRRTSAHYGVGRSGDVHQYVRDTDTAFHAGDFDANLRSIGIEHEDLNADDYTDAQYRASASLIRRICGQNGLPINDRTILPHRAFVATACPGTLDINRLIQLANEGGSMAADAMTESEAQQIYNLATLGDGAPPELLKAWTGQPLGAYVRMLTADPSIKARIKYFKDLEAGGGSSDAAQKLSALKTIINDILK